MSTIGKNLKRLRGKHGFSQQQLGEAIGHGGGAYISAIERGKKHPGPDTLAALAAALGCSVDEFAEPVDPGRLQ